MWDVAPSYELTRCAVCENADSVTIADSDDIRREAELLWAFHARRLAPRTPAERLVDRVAFSQAPPWRVVRCTECGLVYRSPAEDRDRLREIYAGEEPALDALQSLHDTQRGAFRAQLRRLHRHLQRRGSGLEVGSYAGAFLSAARRAGWQFEGVDVNATINAFVRRKGFAVHDGDMDVLPRDRVFDVVAIWNTFDQLPDPRTAVRTAARLLRPNGILALRVPNGACYARWRSGLGAHAAARAVALELLAQNNLLTFPYRFGFTPEALSRLLRATGFEILKVAPATLVPTTDEWTRWWAALEQRVVKPLTRLALPWFELYARRAS
jgi:SAM-dependent methyltransferase